MPESYSLMKRTIPFVLSLSVTIGVCFYVRNDYWTSLNNTLRHGTHEFLKTVSLGNVPHISNRVGARCLNVLGQMTKGTWKTRPLTKQENKEILEFLFSTQTRHRLPRNKQRSDGLCGNVTHTASWFRALCDPKGPTPCCYHNTCAMKTVQECVCEDCYDMRQMKHAEYSTWIPSNPQCSYKAYSAEEACRILNNSTIVLMGDSLVRHVFTALLLIVTGNMQNGAMIEKASEKAKQLCKGMNMFTEKTCRSLLMYTMKPCHQHVKLHFRYFFRAKTGNNVKAFLQNLTGNSLAVLGIGIHGNFSHTDVQKRYLLPFIKDMKSRNTTWPRLLWVDSHSPGVLKSPTVVSQLSDSVNTYNTHMEHFLNARNIPILRTFNLTKGMMSFDGQHYGLGMNLVKANLLLSYIAELRTKEKW